MRLEDVRAKIEKTAKKIESIGLSAHESAALVIGRRGLGYPKRTHSHHKNESETPFGCRVRVNGRILQAIEKRNETTTISRQDVKKDRELQRGT
jgi:hypothetical protein